MQVYHIVTNDYNDNVNSTATDARANDENKDNSNDKNNKSDHENNGDMSAMKHVECVSSTCRAIKWPAFGVNL